MDWPFLYAWETMSQMTEEMSVSFIFKMMFVLLPVFHIQYDLRFFPFLFVFANRVCHFSSLLLPLWLRYYWYVFAMIQDIPYLPMYVTNICLYLIYLCAFVRLTQKTLKDIVINWISFFFSFSDPSHTISIQVYLKLLFMFFSVFNHTFVCFRCLMNLIFLPTFYICVVSLWPLQNNNVSTVLEYGKTIFHFSFVILSIFY